MHISYAGRGVDELADRELVDLMNGALVAGGYRRLRASSARVWVAILRAFDMSGVPMTARGVFYRLASVGVVPKTETAVDRVGEHVLAMRRRGILPYGWVTDGTRRVQKPETFGNLFEFLTISKDTYRRALWAGQPDYVEVWCEKDTLRGILLDVTVEYDVPLMITRGFPSETFVYEAAEAIRVQGKPAFIYYFGDWDYYGQRIADSTRRKLAEFGARAHFEIVSVLPWQIEALDLPTRPPKGSRQAREFGECVELDAVPVDVLRGWVRQSIEAHIDPRELAEARRAETLERETLAEVVSNLRLAGDRVKA